MPSLSQIKLIVALVGALAIAFAASVVTAKVYQGKIATIEAGFAKAEAAAAEQARVLQKAEDQVTLAAAVAEAQAQQKIVTVTNTIVREAPSHVPSSTKCPVTVGFVRVLNSTVFQGTGTTGPTYAPGQPDDACASVDPRTLAINIVGNYAAALANAEQLTALQKWVQDTLDVRKRVLQPAK